MIGETSEHSSNQGARARVKSSVISLFGWEWDNIPYSRPGAPNGRKANPCAALVSSVILPSMDSKTPTLPLNRPTRDRLATGAWKERERPKQSIESVRPKSPINTTGLRPILSDSLPHCKAKGVSTRKNVDSCQDGSYGSA